MRLWNILQLAGVIAVLVTLSYWIGQQAYSWMPTQASSHASGVDDLFSQTVTLGSFIFLGIVGLFTYALVTGRVPPEDDRDGPPITGNPTLETLWTIIPILIVLVLASEGATLYQQMQLQGPVPVVRRPESDGAAHAATMPPDALITTAATPEPLIPEASVPETIEVLAQQWAWVFNYPNQKVTSTELHLPENHHVRLMLKSADVLHGFYVPAFRLKQDMIPNRTIAVDVTPVRSGQYRLYDSQFSGTYVALMTANVWVEPLADYRRWLAQAASQIPVAAINPAFAEYHQATDQVLKKRWPSVVPVPPPVVNQPGYPGGR